MIAIATSTTESEILEYDPGCNFQAICTQVYDNLDQICYRKNDTLLNCQLSRDVKSNKINDSFRVLLNQKVKTDITIDDNSNTCPRSLINRVPIHGRCKSGDCSFYSEKMAYNCFLIHHHIYFKDHAYLPDKVLHIGTGLNKNNYNRMLMLAIYNARAYIILLKYTSENLYRDIDLRFKSKKLKKIFYKKKFNVCPICSYSFKDKDNFNCRCLRNKKLRQRRQHYNKKWKLAIKIAGDRYESKLANAITVKDVVDTGIDINDLKYVRSILCNTSYEGVNFYDIPLGFIIKTYNEMFDDREWRVAENIGLTEEQYEKAKRLFLE